MCICHVVAIFNLLPPAGQNLPPLRLRPAPADAVRRRRHVRIHQHHNHHPEAA